MFLVVLYIAIRFDLKFSLPVIAAMLHDVLICVGVYAVTGREVTTATVAAVLTVLGYSIYDTIIIFDRIRENIPLMRRAPFATITNVSLWETIRRSLTTTLITLLPILALYFFGGATLQDFAFALLIGVTSGAYSSIFIAAPLLAMFLEREPGFVKRRHDLERSGELESPVRRRAPEPVAVPATAPAGDGGPPPPSPSPGAPSSSRRRRRRAHGRSR